MFLFYKEIKKRLFLNMCPNVFSLLHSVGLRMCISCWELFFKQILEKKHSFCCSLILKDFVILCLF